MSSKNIEEIIRKQFKNTLKETNFSIGKLYRGKVRDNYILDDKRIIIASDRLSAFDRVITEIPFKGELLNRISSFWFEQTKDIVPNHLIEVPDPNVSVVHQCETIPVEMVVRAYLTGSMWRKYQKKEPTSGVLPPKGMKKNQKFDEIIVTPSTKAESGHDIYLPPQDLINKGLVDKETYDHMEAAALKLFKFGQEHCKKNGLILVDTKYEFGLKDGELIVIDEIHTQDSSRFWILDSYEDRFSKGETPEILDKEIFRGWLMDSYPNIFPGIKPEQEIPPISDDIKVELTKRYMRSYKRITGLEFKPKIANAEERIKINLKKANFLP